ncbi:MAG: glycosyltransferase family 4 protein [Phycisphaerales bacterium]|nr:glycosyltransferase family 4 protein [Phycisphaerales bacterium]
MTLVAASERNYDSRPNIEQQPHTENRLNICVTSQHRYMRSPDGAVWTDGKYDYIFWTRYLDEFDGVRVIARVRDVPTSPANGKRVDGAGISVAPLPFVRGPLGYLLNARKLSAAARAAVQSGDAVMLRVPGEIALCLDTWMWKTIRPYGVEVVGDPYELYAPGSVKSVFRPLLRAFYPWRMRQECAAAATASYVTESTLQKSYPPASAIFHTHYSSIELDDAAYADSPKRFDAAGSPTRLVFVGTLAQLYKAPDTLLRAFALAVAEKLDLTLTIIGDGQHRAELENLAARLNIAPRVRFAGQLAGFSAVKAELDTADLFVLASHQEGLPRATIEAMARGLPCIGSTVGGTPELLPPEDMVSPGNERALANKITEVVRDPARMTRMAERNFLKSREYHQDRLRTRRAAHYAALKKATQR